LICDVATEKCFDHVSSIIFLLQILRTWLCFVFWIWQSNDGQIGNYYQRYTLLSCCLLTKALGEGAIDDGHERHCKTILHCTNNAYNHEQDVEGIRIKEKFEKQNNVLFFFFFFVLFPPKVSSSSYASPPFLLRVSFPTFWLSLYSLQKL